MNPVRPEGQVFRPAHGADGERAVEMREERAASRRFPLEDIPQRRWVYRKKNDVGLPCTVLARAFGQLLGRGEVGKTVLPVLRGAGIGASRPGFIPLVLAAEMEDEPG